MTTTIEPTEDATTVDEAKVEEFVGKVLTDTSGLTTTVLSSIGDRLGLWKDLAASGPTTSAELAARTGTNERYVREWLGGMAAGGYVEYDRAADRFTLPPEHVPVLAQEGGPVFFGGMHQMIRGMVTVYDQLLEVFRAGGGVPQSAYHDDMWDGMERFTAGWFNNHLVQDWIPALPDVETALERGGDVADIGCGRGRGLIKLAEAYPKSRYVGYDVFEPTIEAARSAAEVAGVSDRVRFEHLDASEGIPGTYDVVFTFDVVHDAVDPRGLLRSIRDALNPGGSYVCLDINCSDNLEENFGPLGAAFHGCSVLYCMTTSLANGGEGLGTVGLHPPKLEELATEAGFSSMQIAPLENPFNNLYELKP
ncbi:MAG: methyltransferase domain-containing protein [Actinobacteria bacterium]|nr:methyltransferase domain-containing protein [Actinomycetota bacterium]